MKENDLLSGDCMPMIKTEVDDGGYAAAENTDYAFHESNNSDDRGDNNFELYESRDMKAETSVLPTEFDAFGDGRGKEEDVKEEPSDYAVSEEGYTPGSSSVITCPIPMVLFMVNRDQASSSSCSANCVPTQTAQLPSMPTHNETTQGHMISMSADRSDLDRNMHWTEERPHHCTDCGKCFRKKAHLVRHVRMHTGEKPFKCRLCEKSFSGCNGFLKHSKTHVGEKPYQCLVCEELFSMKNDMKKHMKSHETDKKLFQCDICYKNFKQSSHVKRHRKTHTGEKPHGCEVCGKHFAERTQLKIHQSAHTDDKPYQCSVCFTHFSREDNLKRHITSHSGVKPYKCDVCAKQFTFTWHLQVHYRTHTGEKPFECSVCFRKFAEKATVRKHMRLHQQ